MRILPTGRLTKAAAALFVCCTLAGAAIPADAANPALVFNPPRLDYSKVCKPQVVALPPLTRDWTTWNGRRFKLGPKDAVALANEYVSGSTRVPRSPQTALKILLAAEKIYPGKRVSMQLHIARAILATAKGTADFKEAQRRLRRAYQRGAKRAAFALGRFYGDGGPTEMHDAKKSRYYYRKAALSSDPDALVEYARLVISDEASSEEQRRLAVAKAFTGLIASIKQGDCSALSRIGFIYLRGSIVQKDVKTALKWLEAFARTGDSKAAMTIAGLYTSNEVDQIDIEKSVFYLKQAADAGVARAQFSIGKSYATGISLSSDRRRSIHYLELAAGQGVAEANEWLARVYAGEFGGAVDQVQANAYFVKAIENENASAEISVSYGKFLAKYGTAKGRLDKTLAMLQQAAESGSVDANDILGRLHLDLGRRDRASYDKALAYFDAAAVYGNSDAAAKLSSMHACGLGVPISFASAKDWRQKAAVYGSIKSVLDTGVDLIESPDLDKKAKGRNYLIQAAYKGNPDAIGYVVARWEEGKDGLEANPNAAARIMTFVNTNNDPALKAAANVAIIRNRYAIAGSTEEKLKQIEALAPYVQAQLVEALIAESEMRQGAGLNDPARQLEINKLLAEKGDPRGMRNYGHLLLTNPDVDVAIGRDWLEKASDAGDLKARLLLIDPANEDALKDLDAIAPSGDVCKIGDMVSVAQAYSGLPDPKARSSALYWLDLARKVATRNGDDLYAVGAAYLAGVGGPDKVAEAEDLYLQALEMGRNSVMLDLANGHLQRQWKEPSAEKAKDYLLALFKLGDMEAGNRFLQAVGDEKIATDLREVDETLDALGADLKSPGKIYLKLARLNLEGRLGAVDTPRSIKWLTISAEAGEPNSMYRLYQIYFFGSGAPMNVPIALEWLERAAEAGKTQAIGEISVAYRVGLAGFPKNDAKADYWMAKLKQLPPSE